MTMLDRMRRHRNWLKWSLVIVCLAFVIFYIPNFLTDPSGDMAATDTVAVVEGREIRADEFQRTYQAQIQAYRSAYGGNMSDQLLRQLGVEQQILQQMVDERAALAEAERLDITVSDEEVRQRILAIPGVPGKRRVHRRRAVSAAAVDAASADDAVRIRGSGPALAGRRQAAGVAHRVAVDSRQGARAGIPPPQRQGEARGGQLPDRQLPARRDRDRRGGHRLLRRAHRTTSGFPRSGRSATCCSTSESLRAKLVVPAADIERAYNDSIGEYTTPEQVRASHILLKIEGKDEAAVRAQAEDVLKKAKAGADFAALAKQYSEDEGSAPNGGDLDFFGRGRMVPEFDAVAFAMEPGQISDLVKTSFGFHIIKLADKKAGTTRTLDEVRPQLQDQLSVERAQQQAANLAESLRARVTKASDLDTVAKEQGLTVQESGFFARDEPMLGLGASPELARGRSR